MQEAFVEINNIPTKVVTYGRWITDKPKKDEKIILIIPGNPGNTGFYKPFMKVLYERHNCPVWIVGHTSHETAPKGTKSDKPLFGKQIGLQEQINRKISFIKDYVPQDAKLHIVAHSIGSYMTLELLKEENIGKRVVQTYLLFPTIERMSVTSNGKFMNRFIRPIIPIAIFLCWFFTILPTIISVNLLKIFMLLTNMPVKDRDPILRLVHPQVLKQVLSLAFQELDEVKERDNWTIRDNINKINILYGENDGWCLPEFYSNITKEFPGIHAEITKYHHAFIFHESEQVAEIVSKWIFNHEA